MVQVDTEPPVKFAAKTGEGILPAAPAQYITSFNNNKFVKNNEYATTDCDNKIIMSMIYNMVAGY